MKGKFNFQFRVNDLGQLEKLLKVTNSNGTIVTDNFEKNVIKMIKTGIKYFSYYPSNSPMQAYKKVQEWGNIQEDFSIITRTYKISCPWWER